MFQIIGIVVVIVAIVGGYLMEHGNLLVLFQPGELVIICGSAIGTVLIANPIASLIRIAKGLVSVIGGSKYTAAFFLDNLKMLYDIFGYARKAGMSKLEGDVDNPKASPLFSKYPRLLANHHALDFICDTFRIFISGGADPFDLDQMMELDMEVHHHEAQQDVSALTAVADALPGLGIVAAVLGVVITMGALGGPPEEMGHKVAAALVGTFLGILLCYGFVGPISANMAKLNEGDDRYLHFLRVGLLAFMKGSSPITAVEYSRRSIPSSVRPSFKVMEEICRGGATGAASPEAAAAA